MFPFFLISSSSHTWSFHTLQLDGFVFCDRNVHEDRGASIRRAAAAAVKFARVCYSLDGCAPYEKWSLWRRSSILMGWFRWSVDDTHMHFGPGNELEYQNRTQMCIVYTISMERTTSFHILYLRRAVISRRLFCRLHLTWFNWIRTRRRDYFGWCCWLSICPRGDGPGKLEMQMTHTAQVHAHSRRFLRRPPHSFRLWTDR